MKVGDKVYCIKTRTGVIDTLNTEGVTYEILKINIQNQYKQVSISCDITKYHIMVHYMYKSDEPSKFYMFDEYFMSPKETRKRKLKKINNAKSNQIL